MRKVILCKQLFTAETEFAQDNMAIVLDDNVITDVVRADEIKDLSGFDEVLDLSDKFVLPGLFDCHAHCAFNGSFSETSDQYMCSSSGPFIALKAIKNLQDDLMAGFTSIRDLGCCPSPFDSYLMMIGLETLSLRVKHQVESTWKLAEYCRSHPKVERVSFVGFDTHPSHENARKYYRYGSSAVFTVELKGTLESTVRFVESLRLAANMTMIGDSITVVTHPASTTHKQLSDADLTAAGVTPTLLRISLGLENADDLIEDFEQAFAQIG